MNDNDKIDNTAGPPEQNSSSPTPQSQRGLAPQNDADSFASAVDRASLTTDNCRLPADRRRLASDKINQCQPSTHPTIHSSARRPRAPYRHRNHRRTGKVARLPRAIRNEIALMFTRHTEYKDIIAWLASQGHSNISESNLSRWRKGGFLDWLGDEQKKRLDLIQFTLDLLELLAAAEEARTTDLKAGPPSTLNSQPSTLNKE